MKVRVPVLVALVVCVGSVRYRAYKKESSVCVGSGDLCTGNDCCPGYPASRGKTFPCPTANVSAANCESDIRYDLYSSSLMDFSYVEYDGLSAETAGNDGEAVLQNVISLSGKPLAMKVQAVDGSGNRVALTENVFKAIKPEEVGSILRFDFNGRSSARLRFSFGLYEDGVWTDVAVPWMSITLMDFDCGSKRDQCEQVSSTDHTFYRAGSSVAVVDSGDQVLFKDTMISNAENNPHSVILNDVQKALSAALFFENMNNFTLGMHNYAHWPRTILLAGITNFQWEELETVAPTPSPTVEPTPFPTRVTTATPMPTPAPTCPFSLSSGTCTVVCDCITSASYPGNYGANDFCEVDVLYPSTLAVKDFSTEVFSDKLSVDGQGFSGLVGPEHVEATSRITWTTDDTNQEKGWHICAVVPTPMPTPSPTSSPTVPMLVVHGSCYGDDACVYSPHYPSHYGSAQSCSIKAQRDLTLHVSDFSTEKGYDFLTVNDEKYSGLTSPHLVALEAGSLFVWSTDWGTTHKGWRMCVEDFTTTTPEILTTATDPEIVTTTTPPETVANETMPTASVNSMDVGTAAISTTDPSSASAVGDPHVSSVTGETFDLWRTGWSTFVQIPRHPGQEMSRLWVRGEVRPYTAAPCAPAFLQQVRVNGSWLGTHEVSVHAGSLESSNPFYVTLDGGEPMHLSAEGDTTFNLGKGDLLGRIAIDDPALWGPDARVALSLGDATVNIVQHTEGRGESSNSMLDLSVSGLGNVIDVIGGWLGVDGSQHAGQVPAQCLEDVALADVQGPRYTVKQIEGGVGGMSL
mmetsp:Transcript_19269/g.51468  ORF Transcript_19269/g.51468 Transcript_19269/m.51468 type:complete len:803 (-) Transcript_19269:275-2683(-)|eukprot:CAMPEP_0194505776 /NCGR_PEP_ID=MMETSP0253-20130528/33015_1 /TAXON_ID=2966 /ORGANISM="Noctiluca scintillans" /LENGTH=802 /DNA_ID=CAMNT_0039348391 /DNA_START=24 /DNA_END=2432 /DNA_ORIENTATION=+